MAKEERKSRYFDLRSKKSFLLVFFFLLLRREKDEIPRFDLRINFHFERNDRGGAFWGHFSKNLGSVAPGTGWFSNLEAKANGEVIGNRNQLLPVAYFRQPLLTQCLLFIRFDSLRPLSTTTISVGSLVTFV